MTYLFKRSYEPHHNQQPTNMHYAPILNDNGTLTMVYQIVPEYRNLHQSEELLNFCFNRELDFLNKFKDYEWCPKITEIDPINRHITIVFKTSKTVNEVVTDPNQSLDTVCPDWIEQITQIVTDIVNEGYYKMTLYPHCFFLDENNRIKTLDMYACVSIEERFLDRTILEGIIGPDSGAKFDSVTVNGKIDFKQFFQDTLTNYLGSSWIAHNPFPAIYQKLKQDVPKL